MLPNAEHKKVSKEPDNQREESDTRHNSWYRTNCADAAALRRLVLCQKETQKQEPFPNLSSSEGLVPQAVDVNLLWIGTSCS